MVISEDSIRCLTILIYTGSALFTYYKLIEAMINGITFSAGFIIIIMLLTIIIPGYFICF